VQDLFPLVIVAVVVLAGVVAVVLAFASRGTYDQIGRSTLSFDKDAPRSTNDGLRDEIQAFVESRNERRIARGLEPLDVEAEVERRLNDADG
jgi:uncharacterized membrane-anchored protein